MKKTLVGFLLVAAVVAYMAMAATLYLGARLWTDPSEKNFRIALRWNGNDAEVWRSYARFVLFDPAGFRPREAVEAFRQAARRNPFEPHIWDDFATAYEQLQEMDKAEMAMRGELAATPHSPEAAWRLANFLMRRDRSSESLPYLRRAAVSGRSLRPAVFSVAWKITDDAGTVLRDVVPAESEARLDYLNFLIQQKKLAECYDVWKELRPARSPGAVHMGLYYVESLAHFGMGADAARVWDEILADTGRASSRPGAELITNGDFEAELLNRGLDWRLSSGSGYRMDLDNFVYQRGSRSLRLSFDGSANANLVGPWQRVPVEANRSYRFRGYLKTDNITSDKGVSFCIQSATPVVEEQFTVCTRNRVGTDPWLLEQLEFRTGPATRMIQVAVHRSSSQKLNNRLRGRAWIDNLSLEPLL